MEKSGRDALIFPVCVIGMVALAMARPAWFGQYGGFDLKNLIVPLVQIIMFGMGTKLSLPDFQRVIVMPRPVLVGVGLHYTVMPLAGYVIAKGLRLPADVAAGVILVGSVSSGVSSNLIAYLAGANVALAVTITACSTLVSPLFTPFLMKVLAGHLVPINFVGMLVEILNMILAPVLSGLAANRVLYGDALWTRSTRPLCVLAAGGLGAAAAFLSFPGLLPGPARAIQSGAAVAAGLIGLVAAAKLMVGVFSGNPGVWMDRLLPLVSMAGICVIVAIITSRSRERLIAVGGTLVLAAVLHNAVGYTFGYWLARIVQLDKITSRTIAIEVGMQNGGMATGLAMSVLKSADAALAPAIFGPWMNVSGALLAGWWRRRPVAVPVGTVADAGVMGEGEAL